MGDFERGGYRRRESGVAEEREVVEVVGEGNVRSRRVFETKDLRTVQEEEER